MPSPLAIPDSLADQRVHPEDPATGPLLPYYLKDRWRVFNCSAFRRLQYKTQVFVTDEGDHYRTRLTHTLEVAQIACLLAAQLGLNERVTEVLAVVHDLGHPPFGHAGEATLQELMQSHGGFNHNLQALRVIDLLEHPYRLFYGLNLANVIRWSHQLHAGVPADSERGDLPADWRQQPLEGQIVSVADRIAYDVHDIEDALGADLVSERDLSELSLWRSVADPVRRHWADVPLPAIRRHILDALAFQLVQDLVSQTRQAMRRYEGATWETFYQMEPAVVTFSSDMEVMLHEHEAFLHEHAYRHARVAAMDYKARLIIKPLFEAHLEQPRLLPARYFRRIEQQGLHRVVCDYLAGMTDRFCQDSYHGLFQPFQRL
jgi:dGTPase